MTTQRTYLDWNASAPIFPEVVEAMAEVLLAGGNASFIMRDAGPAIKSNGPVNRWPV